MANFDNELKIKIDEIFGFNLLRSIDGVNYNFGQYKLNQLYRPLVNYFVKEFSEHLNSLEDSKANDELTLFIDFFKTIGRNVDQCILLYLIKLVREMKHFGDDLNCNLYNIINLEFFIKNNKSK